MFCIVLADRPRGSCKCTFLRPGLSVEKLENAALVFSCGQRICIRCVSMTPSPPPWPLAFDLLTPRCLITTTIADYMPFSSSCCVQFLLRLSVCIQLASFTRMLFFCVFGEFLAPPIGLEYQLKCIESFTRDLFGHKYSWNDAVEDGGEKDNFGACGHGSSQHVQELLFNSLNKL